MIRVDKTLKEMMEEKPYGRLDPEYYLPEYDDLFLEMRLGKFDINTLGNFILPGTEGITYGQVGERHYSKKGKVQYLQVSNITFTGIDVFAKFALVDSGSHNDPPRSRLKENDILLLNGGVGSIGRSCVLLKKDKEYNISQDIDRVRVQGINPIYVSVFINSFFGQKQIERFQKGVSGQTKIGFDHVKSIKIPVIPEKIQSHISGEYKKMSAYHDKAMEAKAEGNETKYKKNIEIAETMLKELIAKTEAVIRGEREDVV
jgi:restriction endonuclease S subunit